MISNLGYKFKKEVPSLISFLNDLKEEYDFSDTFKGSQETSPIKLKELGESEFLLDMFYSDEATQAREVISTNAYPKHTHAELSLVYHRLSPENAAQFIVNDLVNIIEVGKLYRQEGAPIRPVADAKLSDGGTVIARGGIPYFQPTEIIELTLVNLDPVVGAMVNIKQRQEGPLKIEAIAKKYEIK